MAPSIETQTASLSLRLRLQLENLGVEMASLNEIDDSSHYLLMPRNVRLNLEKWGDGEWTQKEGVTMEWDSLARVPMAPRDSVQCLWDLVDLSQVHPSQFPPRLLAFVAIWGIINFDAIYMELDRPSSSDVHWSWCLSQILQATLVGLVSTEEKDLVDDETILRIAGWEFNEKTKIEHEFVSSVDQVLVTVLLPNGRVVSRDEWESIERETHLNAWHRERELGRGNTFQRMIVAGGVNYLISEGSMIPIWDDNGRRIEMAAEGVEQIVGSHMRTIFGSLQLDVYRCSICGRPFPFTETHSHRRPRRGTRRFCSPDCKADGKRQANLNSWHRNKDRWLPRRRNATD